MVTSADNPLTVVLVPEEATLTWIIASAAVDDHGVRLPVAGAARGRQVDRDLLYAGAGEVVYRDRCRHRLTPRSGSSRRH